MLFAKFEKDNMKNDVNLRKFMKFLIFEHFIKKVIENRKLLNEFEKTYSQRLSSFSGVKSLVNDGANGPRPGKNLEMTIL